MEPREFTRQLLARLAGPCPAGTAPGRRQIPGGAWLLLVTDLAAEDARPVWREAAALRRPDLSLAVMAERGVGERLLRTAAPDCIFPLEEPLPGGIRTGLKAILAVPSRDLLIRLALGLGDRPAADLILRGIWRGLPVYMDFSRAAHSGWTPCASPALEALYRRYADQLIALGVRPAAPGTCRNELRGDVRSGPDVPLSAPVGRRVVTQSDVLKREPAAGEWVLPWGTIVTHLARDAAKQRGLLLRVEGPPPEASEQGGSAVWSLRK